MFQDLHLKSACEQLRAGLSSFASTVVSTDAYIAWLGAHQGGDGGIVILGTGLPAAHSLSHQYLFAIDTALSAWDRPRAELASTLTGRNGESRRSRRNTRCSD